MCFKQTYCEQVVPFINLTLFDTYIVDITQQQAVKRHASAADSSMNETLNVSADSTMNDDYTHETSLEPPAAKRRLTEGTTHTAEECEVGETSGGGKYNSKSRVHQLTHSFRP